MELINFINTHNNWEELLSAPPYCLNIKHEDDYVLIRCDAVMSDFSYELCKEAQGIIIRKINEKWFISAQGLNKFFNYNEIYSDLKEIDWNNCVVNEHIDGTNIRIYMNDGYWHVSTLENINAFKSNFRENITYGDLVNQACGGNIEILTSQLDPLYCYYFELTGPNKVIINYGENPTLWYLGRRAIIDSKENFEEIEFKNLDIKYPKIYNINSLKVCIDNAEKMEKEQKGYVVTSVDNKNNKVYRIKIQGAKYMQLHQLYNNGILTIVQVLSMWRKNILDDYLTAFPENKIFIQQVFTAIKILVKQLENTYSNIVLNSNIDKKVIIEKLRTQPPLYPLYIFTRLDGKVKDATEFIEHVPINKLASGILPYM